MQERGASRLDAWFSKGLRSAALGAALLGCGMVQALPLRQVTIQAYQVCDDAGNNCATTSLFADFTAKIWAQADIVVNFLAMQVVNSSARLNEDNFSDLGANANSSIINLWFVNDLTDCGGPVGGTLFGCGTSGGWFALTQAVFDYSAVGRVDTLSHELGHVLGLGHADFGAGAADNLMTSGNTRGIPQLIGDVSPDGLGLDKLTDEQIAEARGSRYTSALRVPEPGSMTLALFALVGLGLRRRREAA